MPSPRSWGRLSRKESATPVPSPSHKDIGVSHSSASNGVRHVAASPLHRITPADVLCYGAVVALLAAVILALCAATWLVS